MMEDVMENIVVFGPLTAIMWIVTIICTIRRPQKYFNSMLLLASLFLSMLFVAMLFGENGAILLLVMFVAVMLALLLVPALLIINGIQMIKRESICPAHLLSLGLGLFVGIGEIATFIYVLGLSDSIMHINLNRFVIFIALTVFYFSFLVLSFVIYSVFIQVVPHRMNFRYVIIHGCGLAGGERLTKLLSDRVDKAIEIYKKCRRKPIIIPSGGKGDDEKLSEAQAMKNYLLEHGVKEDHIIMEDRSATTRENLLFSKAIIDQREGDKKTALVTSNYHVYRCLRLARKEGFKCTGIGAHTALYYWPSALIREFAAVFVSKEFFVWSMIGYLVFISPLIYALIRG